MIKKFLSRFFLLALRVGEVISTRIYIRLFPKYLAWLGVDIDPRKEVGYIHPSVEFDGNDYSLISIGEATTISKNVLLLTHDYSIKKGLRLKGDMRNVRFLKSIKIGNNSFIGARVCILPGTEIGNNVIVGTGAVVKGKIPNNSIVVGNPAKVVADIVEWADRHIEKGDFQEE